MVPLSVVDQARALDEPGCDLDACMTVLDEKGPLVSVAVWSPGNDGWLRGAGGVHPGGDGARSRTKNSTVAIDRDVISAIELNRLVPFSRHPFRGIVGKIDETRG